LFAAVEAWQAAEQRAIAAGVGDDLNPWPYTRRADAATRPGRGSQSQRA
jgi:hypothetical protein